MGLDIRIPIGLLFLAVGAELGLYSITAAAHALNTVCAAAFIVFGAVFLLSSRLAGRGR